MTSSALNPSVVAAMTIVEYLILIVLATGPRHGYGIMQAIAARTNNEVRLVPGTLYGALKRMLNAGWIKELDEAPAPDLDNERRRYYCLSPRGREMVLAEIKRMEYLAQQGRVELRHGEGVVEAEEQLLDPPGHINGKPLLMPPKW